MSSPGAGLVFCLMLALWAPRGLQISCIWVPVVCLKREFPAESIGAVGLMSPAASTDDGYVQ